MSDQISLDEVKAFATELSPWAHLATVGADGEPDVVPVHPCWEGDTLWIMAGVDSVKASNMGANDRVALHWQVSEVGDGVEVWGTAEMHTDPDTKRRLWNGDVFDYDLNAFAPGGPDNSPGTGFVAVTPSRAVVLKQYGAGGVQRWSASST
ncbi:pyridoxamine 5'-phosphate oxidase family protein [Euzebya tangerina]|uniref:pyridoxamine 5'-phosphate oxidase family protein n=1 Tax=Euzebya tangerina TaxID=591198 RepID=UPI000E31410D|nr:pyridoxamine 5'-phosphate oxidase family protein [Euzebya tangerina]